MGKLHDGKTNKKECVHGHPFYTSAVSIVSGDSETGTMRLDGTSTHLCVCRWTGLCSITHTHAQKIPTASPETKV